MNSANVMNDYSLKYKVNDLIFKIFPCKSIFKKLYIKFLILVNGLVKKHSLNIGGGSDFLAMGWLNLEEVKSDINADPFKLTHDCRFPVKDDSITTVYTSHCLEHLDNDTVNTILSETLRVLKKDGRFIVKVPDFDLILSAWRTNDAGFFATGQWVNDSVVHTWKNRNIEDCLDYRAVMFFCGFYNDAYGDLFGTKIAKDKSPYHGPPVVDVKYLRELISKCTPSQISMELSNKVMQNENDYHFNHRNAWSRSELAQLLNATGFQVVTFDKEEIVDKCKDIPGILEMKEESMYCLLKKRT